MRRIYRDSHCKIEHLVPLSRDKEKALDYHNLLGVCDGGEKSEKSMVVFYVVIHIKRKRK